MDEIDIRQALASLEEAPKFSMLFADSDKAEMIAQHRNWLQSIRKERPLASTPYKIGVYIRYFNQTKYDNYLDYHIKGFEDAISLCPKWELVDFYVDEGSNAPNMENAEDWCKLIEDCLAGKINLIITQKVSNVSKKPHEITLLARMLATQDPPIGIYFISEDIFTLASYYTEDLRDLELLPEGWSTPDEHSLTRGELYD